MVLFNSEENAHKNVCRALISKKPRIPGSLALEWPVNAFLSKFHPMIQSPNTRGRQWVLHLHLQTLLRHLLLQKALLILRNFFPEMSQKCSFLLLALVGLPFCHQILLEQIEAFLQMAALMCSKASTLWYTPLYFTLHDHSQIKRLRNETI